MVATEAFGSKPMTMKEELEAIKREQAGLATTDSSTAEQVNPFQKRASKCADISSDLLGFIEAYWELATEIQSNSV
ncbi:hypothetical protein GGH92_005206 [Coemansia sp. RSA 2673]|nr:hypothetical protein GGH92_005206 [Coemansia sp. RSA 2673]